MPRNMSIEDQFNKVKTTGSFGRPWNCSRTLLSSLLVPVYYVESSVRSHGIARQSLKISNGSNESLRRSSSTFDVVLAKSRQP